jgi:hypothetical protein
LAAAGVSSPAWLTSVGTYSTRPGLLGLRLKDHNCGLHGAARGVGIEVLVDLPPAGPQIADKLRYVAALPMMIVYTSKVV